MHAAADFNDFSALMRKMCVVFSKKATDELVNSYWDALKDLQLTVVRRCADNHARYGKFFPKPFDLRPKDDQPSTVKEDKDFQSAVRQNIMNWEERMAQEPVRGLELLKEAHAARLAVRERESLPDCDKWDQAANHHLFALVLRQLALKRTFNEQQTRILVAYKHRWAKLMREIDTGDGVDESEQKEIWGNCMREAEAQFA